MLLNQKIYDLTRLALEFQWAPTLGGECYALTVARTYQQECILAFQWAPTLGGECYLEQGATPSKLFRPKFQWAPTLGGECYMKYSARFGSTSARTSCFNGHPPLGVNATYSPTRAPNCPSKKSCFNGHPPLGVNATFDCSASGYHSWYCSGAFQWAPTLGGECYGIVYLITPPLCQGVNALLNISQRF